MLEKFFLSTHVWWQPCLAHSLVLSILNLALPAVTCLALGEAVLEHLLVVKLATGAQRISQCCLVVLGILWSEDCWNEDGWMLGMSLSWGLLACESIQDVLADLGCSEEREPTWWGSKQQLRSLCLDRVVMSPKCYSIDLKQSQINAVYTSAAEAMVPRCERFKNSRTRHRTSYVIQPQEGVCKWNQRIYWVRRGSTYSAPFVSPLWGNGFSFCWSAWRWGSRPFVCWEGLGSSARRKLLSDGAFRLGGHLWNDFNFLFF